MQGEEKTIPQMADEVRTGKMARRQFIQKLRDMGITTAGVGAIIATISGSSASSASLASHTQDHQQHIQLHDQHLTHQSQGNTQQLHKDYTEHAIVEDSLYAEPMVGRAAIMERKNVIMAAASDANITITNRILNGNQVTAEWIATGIHTGDLPGMPASGLPFTLRGVTVVVRENGKIVREALYYNVADLHKQVGSAQE